MGKWTTICSMLVIGSDHDEFLVTCCNVVYVDTYIHVRGIYIYVNIRILRVDNPEKHVEASLNHKYHMIWLFLDITSLQCRGRSP